MKQSLDEISIENKNLQVPLITSLAEVALLQKCAENKKIDQIFRCATMQEQI